MKRHEQWFREAWTERVPAPLDMSDTEILDWMNEYSWLLKEEGGVWHIDSGTDESVTASTVREVVKLAAAYHREMNA